MPDQNPNPEAPERKTTQLRIEADLLSEAGEIAKKLRMSQNAYICLAVENQVKADKRRLESA